MTGPSLTAAPTADEIRAITCPIERAKTITEVARRVGTLSSLLHGFRRQALSEARQRHSAGQIAIRVGMSRGRVFQLTRADRPAVAPQLAVGVPGRHPECAHREDLPASEGALS